MASSAASLEPAVPIPPFLLSPASLVNLCFNKSIFVIISVIKVIAEAAF